MSPDGSDPIDDHKVIDLMPMIRARRDSKCPHLYVEVDETIASLTCRDCHSQVDPWWWLRSQAKRLTEWAAMNERFLAESRAIKDRHDAWALRANEKVTKLTAEINRLHAIKVELLHERIGDVRLVDLVDRSGRRRKR